MLAKGDSQGKNRSCSGNLLQPPRLFSGRIEKSRFCYLHLASEILLYYEGRNLSWWADLCIILMLGGFSLDEWHGSEKVTLFRTPQVVILRQLLF